MCGIIASENINFIREMVPLIINRGIIDRSTIACFDGNGCQRMLYRENEDYSGSYFIFHTQAPTTANPRLHPAEGPQDEKLWHNGILKDAAIEHLQQKIGTKETWDTSLILLAIHHFGYGILSVIDGSFACLRYSNGKIQVFRNEIAPLFNDGTSLCSVKFKNSRAIDPGVVYEIDSDLIRTPDTFKTNRLPYFLGA